MNNTILENKNFVSAIEDNKLLNEKEKQVIKSFLRFNSYITAADITDVCGFSKQMAYIIINKLVKSNLLNLIGSANEKPKISQYQLNYAELEDMLERYIKKQEIIAQTNKSNE